MAYAQHAAKLGDRKLALSILKQHLDKSAGEGHPTSRDLRDRLEAGESVPFLVTSVEEGMSEVFYGLGEALTGEGGISIGALYLQMALYVDPDNVPALMALAGAYESARRYEDAIAIYDRIGDNKYLGTEIAIRKAFDLNSLEKVDEAKEGRNAFLEKRQPEYPDTTKYPRLG